MPWGAVAIAGASVVSGVLGADAAEDAANISANATDRSTALQREMYQTTRSDLAPYRDAGSAGLARLMYLTGLGGSDTGDGQYGSLMRDFSMKDFEKDPGYQFRLEEGEKGLNRAMAARGLANSTPGLRSLMRFNQGFASDEFGKSYARFEASKGQKFNLLSYLAGTGQNAAAMTGQVGTNTAAGASQAMMQGAAAQGNAALMGGAAWNNAIQGGIGNFMYQQRWDQMMNRFPVLSGPTTTGGINWMNTGGFETTGGTA